MHSRGFVDFLLLRYCYVILLVLGFDLVFFSFVFCSKGISASALPYKRSSPTWLKTTAQDVRFLRNLRFWFVYLCSCWHIRLHGLHFYCRLLMFGFLVSALNLVLRPELWKRNYRFLSVMLECLLSRSGIWSAWCCQLYTFEDSLIFRGFCSIVVHWCLFEN